MPLHKYQLDLIKEHELPPRVHAVVGATLFLSGYALEISQALIEKDNEHLVKVLDKYHMALEQAINTFDELDLYCKGLT